MSEEDKIDTPAEKLAAGMAVLILSVLLFPLFGYGIGWLVGLLFEETFLRFFALIGVEGFTLAEITAFLMFIRAWVFPIKGSDS